jgi:hypothetical protein
MKMDSWTIYRTPYQIGTDGRSYLWKCLEEDESATHVLCNWGFSSFTISSPGSVLHGTKWLLWRPHKQSPTCHSKCGINRGLNLKKGKHNRSVMVAAQGPVVTHPLHTRTHEARAHTHNYLKLRWYGHVVILIPVTYFTCIHVLRA